MSPESQADSPASPQLQARELGSIVKANSPQSDGKLLKGKYLHRRRLASFSHFLSSLASYRSPVRPSFRSWLPLHPLIPLAIPLPTPNCQRSPARNALCESIVHVSLKLPLSNKQSVIMVVILRGISARGAAFQGGRLHDVEGASSRIHPMELSHFLPGLCSRGARNTVHKEVQEVQESENPEMPAQDSPGRECIDDSPEPPEPPCGFPGSSSETRRGGCG
jgi:hypothetical protein